jgi:hypothetical protein
VETTSFIAVIGAAGFGVSLALQETRLGEFRRRRVDYVVFARFVPVIVGLRRKAYRAVSTVFRFAYHAENRG